MAEPSTTRLTRSKASELRAELDHKINVERPALAARLKAAIELGDLSENADYHAAKEAQGFLEGSINELKNLLASAVIIEDRDVKRVTVVEEGEDEEETYMIVSPAEANPGEGKISYESPLGKALMSAKVGEMVKISAPDGEIHFRVTRVE